MKLLEEDLASSANAACNSAEIVSEEDILSEAFAFIKLVHPGSPAAISGLKENDFLVQFGSVTKENFKTMKDITNAMRCSIRTEMLVIVRRQGTSSQLRLKLTPMSWSGQGFLGCKIDPIPFDNAER